MIFKLFQVKESGLKYLIFLFSKHQLKKQLKCKKKKSVSEVITFLTSLFS